MFSQILKLRIYNFFPKFLFIYFSMVVESFDWNQTIEKKLMKLFM